MLEGTFYEDNLSRDVKTTLFINYSEDVIKVSGSAQLYKPHSATKSGKILDFNYEGSLVKLSSMVYVEGGSFYMSDRRNQKYHKVTVSDFEIDSVETVMMCSWWEAVAECNRMSRKKGYNPCYVLNGTTDEREWGYPPRDYEDVELWSSIECNFNADGYRLPTSAEWEWAARGGVKSKGYKYSGSNNIDEVGWYKENSPDVDRRYFDRGGVAPDINGNYWQKNKKMPNELGIYDMSGNLWEWVWDWYYPYSELPQKNPKGYSDSECGFNCKTVRGGSWISSVEDCEVKSYSWSETIPEAVGYVALRVCRSLTRDHFDRIILEQSEENKNALKPVMIYVPCANAPASLNIEPYEISETELSRELYALIRGTELYQPEGNLPVEGVSWYEAVELCNLLSFMYGYTPCYSLGGKTNPDEWNNDDGLAWKKIKCDFSADGYRLPTETEWNYAAESGKTGKRLMSECWYSENSGGRCHAVLSKAMNSLGIYNMLGNVQEWCWESVAKNNPEKVLKGGGYNSNKDACYPKVRKCEAPDVEGGITGVRLCRSLNRTPKKKSLIESITGFFIGLFK